MPMWKRVCGVLVACVLAGSVCWAEDKLKLSDDEQKILDLTNAARAKEKLPALKANATLFKVARAHSKNMAKKGEMKHELDGKTPAQRVEAAGYDYRATGENIAAGAGW